MRARAILDEVPFAPLTSCYLWCDPKVGISLPDPTDRKRNGRILRMQLEKFTWNEKAAQYAVSEDRRMMRRSATVREVPVMAARLRPSTPIHAARSLYVFAEPPVLGLHPVAK